MGAVYICDGDRKTVLKPDTMERTGWGHERLYSPGVMEAVDAYTTACIEAAAKARVVFEKEREKARKAFKKLYPNGLLPDEVEEVDLGS